MKKILTTIALGVLMLGSSSVVQANNEKDTDIKKQVKAVQKTLPQEVASNVEFTKCLFNKEDSAYTFVCTLKDATNEQTALHYYQNIYSTQEVSTFFNKLIKATKMEISEDRPITIVAQDMKEEVVWQETYTQKQFKSQSKDTELTTEMMDVMMSAMIASFNKQCPLEVVGGLSFQKMTYKTSTHTLTIHFIMGAEFEDYLVTEADGTSAEEVMETVYYALRHEIMSEMGDTLSKLGFKINCICYDDLGQERFSF